MFDLSSVGLGTFEGLEAVRGLFEDWWGGYEDYEQEAEETHDLGNGVTFGVLTMRGRSARSAAWVEQRYAAVATWADGLIERTTNSFDIGEARAAAERLAESRGSAMSQSNVEFTSQVMDALGRRDISRVIALTDPDVEWHSFFAELARAMREWLSSGKTSRSLPRVFSRPTIESSCPLV